MADQGRKGLSLADLRPVINLVSDKLRDKDQIDSIVSVSNLGLVRYPTGRADARQLWAAVFEAALEEPPESLILLLNNIRDSLGTRSRNALEVALREVDPAPAVAGDKPSTPASGVSGPAYPGHAFISYVREDSREVDALQRVLEAAGIQVWRDKASLWPGDDWHVKIRDAITGDALVFIACFSSHSVARRKSYQNEELLLAIDQLRLRRPDDPWLIPVRFDECNVPNLHLGAGRTLGSIHRADLFGPNRDAAAGRLVEAVRRLLGQQKGEASPQLITATPHAPERVDLSRALVAQCPNCGSFDLDGTEYTLEWKFGCFECAHAWTWRKDAPWPPVHVRPEVRGQEVSSREL